MPPREYVQFLSLPEAAEKFAPMKIFAPVQFLAWI
jgi:hypothetical protein